MSRMMITIKWLQSLVGRTSQCCHQTLHANNCWQKLSQNANNIQMSDSLNSYIAVPKKGWRRRCSLHCTYSSFGICYFFVTCWKLDVLLCFFAILLSFIFGVFSFFWVGELGVLLCLFHYSLNNWGWVFHLAIILCLKKRRVLMIWNMCAFFWGRWGQLINHKLYAKKQIKAYSDMLILMY